MTREQIKRTILLVVFITVTLATLQFSLTSLMGSMRTGTVGKINAIMYHDLDPEFTIWGASTAEVNFNATLINEALGIHTMNMGINGTNIDEYNGLLYEYLASSKNAKYIVIALDIHSGLSKRQGFYHIHNWLHHINNEYIYYAFAGIDHGVAFKARYVPFYKSILYDKHSISSLKLALFNNKDDYYFPNLGWNPTKGNMSVSAANQHIDTEPFDVQIDKEVLTTLMSVCKAAIDKNIHPIVVLTPTYAGGMAKIKNEEAFVKSVTSAVGKNGTVYNFLNCSISDDSQNFKDNTHLNVIGANKFTKLFLQKFKEKKQN